MHSHPRSVFAASRRILARIVVVTLVAGGLFAFAPRGAIEPAAATESATIWNVGTMCDGSGSMSGYFEAGMPGGLMTITRLWVPSGATVTATGQGTYTGSPQSNIAFGLQEAGNGANIQRWANGHTLDNFPADGVWDLPGSPRVWTNSSAGRWVEAYGYLGQMWQNVGRWDWTINIAVAGGSGFDGIDCVEVEANEMNVSNPAIKWGCPARGAAADPVCTLTGNFSTTVPGLEVTGRGPGLNLHPNYNAASAATDVGLGHGWSHDYAMELVSNPDGSKAVVQGNGSIVRFFASGGGWIAPRRTTATLVADGSNWLFTRRHFEIFKFNSAGRLVEVRDRNGYSTSLTYDGSNQLDLVQDSAGRTLDLTWTSGHISAIADSRSSGDGGPRIVSLVYDGAGDLTEYTDAGDGEWAFAYDSHRLVTLRKPENAAAPSPQPVVTNHYDGAGRIDWQDDELGRRTELHYDDPIAGATRVVSPDGDQRVDYYDAHGLRTKVTVGYGTGAAVTTDYTYDPVTRAPLTETVNGRTWRYHYDLAGNRTSVISPVREIKKTSFNGLDLPLTVTEPGSGSAAVTTTFTYDNAGNLEKVDRPLVGTSSIRTTDYVYGDSSHPGDVTGIIDERGKTTSVAYDAAGNVESVADPLGNTTTWDHNSIGWITSAVAPKGNAPGGVAADFTTTYSYDAQGRVTGTTGPSGTITREFDLGGRLILVRDQANRETTFEYDVAGQLRFVERPDTTRLENEYWDDGNLRAQIDAATGRTEYGYDPSGRLISTTDPLGRATVLAYDAGGRLSSRQAAGGDCSTSPGTLCTRYTYNTDNTLATVNYSDSTPDVMYTYWESGRPKTMADGQGTTTWNWDSLGRMTSQQSPGGNCGANPATNCTKYGYADLSPFATTVTYPGNKTVTRTRDDAGRMQSVSDWLTNATSFSYDDNSNVHDVTFPAPTGNVDSYEYDDADRVSAISMAGSSSVLADLAYTRDPRGLVESITGTNLPSASYGYDDNGRLTHQESTEAWAYDSADNLTKRAVVAGEYRQVFDAANQLCFSAPVGITGGACGAPPTGATNYAYDTRGNRTSVTEGTTTLTTHTYDEADRLTSTAIAPTWLPAYTSSVNADQPFSWWRLGENSGTTATDNTASGQHGTYTNNPTLAGAGALTADTDTAVTLNGTNQYVALPNGFNALGNATGFTIEGWVKPTAARTWARLAEFGTGPSSNNVLLSAGGPSGNDVAFSLRNNGQSTATSSSAEHCR